MLLLEVSFCSWFCLSFFFRDLACELNMCLAFPADTCHKTKTSRSWHMITSQENRGQTKRTQTYSRKAKQNRSKTESLSLVVWLFCCFVSSKFVVKCIGVIKSQRFMYVCVCLCELADLVTVNTKHAVNKTLTRLKTQTKMLRAARNLKENKVVLR